MREDMHARGIHPDEEWLSRLDLFAHESDRPVRRLVVNRLHALDVERPAVLDLAAGVGVDDAAHVIDLEKSRVVFRPIRHLRLLLGVQVIEIPVELVEAVVGGKIFVTVTEMVLSELPGGITKRLERLRDGDVPLLKTNRRSGSTNFRKPCTDWRLPGNERGAARGAAVLACPMSSPKMTKIFGFLSYP